jgi:hypothetical protein
MKFSITEIYPRNIKILYLLNVKYQAFIYVIHAKHPIRSTVNRNKWPTSRLSHLYLCWDSTTQIANSVKATWLATHLIRILIFLICIVGGGVQTGSTRHVGHLLAYCTCPGWLWVWRIGWNEWQGKPKYSEKTCPDATLSTTNPTWPDPGLNPGCRGGKQATNRFSYGAA